jgi:hypothetical protein
MARRSPGSEASLPELRQKITDLVSRNAVAMVQCAIDGVMEEGQYQAIKYLFEMVGIYPAVSGEGDAPEDSLSKVLLRHLGVPEKRTQSEPGSSRDNKVHPVE